jgi:hypothetical protein
MKMLGLLRWGCIAILFGRFLPGTPAQNKPDLSPQLSRGSSVSEIVEWLDKNSFSHARIGLEFKGPESYADATDAMQSIGLSTSRLSERLIFSPGFRLLEAQGCRLTLKNDQVRILKAWTGSYDTYQMSFANFLYEGKKGEKKLTPQSAVLSIPLNKTTGSKKPYQLIKSPEQAKLLGTWRTEFKEKGFFRRSVFEMEITAAEGPNLKGKMNAGTLTFTFDDKDESERFDTAFREVIKLCAK